MCNTSRIPLPRIINVRCLNILRGFLIALWKRRTGATNDFLVQSGTSNIPPACQRERELWERGGGGLYEECLALCVSSQHTDELLSERPGEQRCSVFCCTRGRRTEADKRTELKEKRNTMKTFFTFSPYRSNWIPMSVIKQKKGKSGNQSVYFNIHSWKTNNDINQPYVNKGLQLSHCDLSFVSRRQLKCLMAFVYSGLWCFEWHLYW